MRVALLLGSWGEQRSEPPPWWGKSPLAHEE